MWEHVSTLAWMRLGQAPCDTTRRISCICSEAKTRSTSKTNPDLHYVLGRVCVFAVISRCVWIRLSIALTHPCVGTWCFGVNQASNALLLCCCMEHRAVCFCSSSSLVNEEHSCRRRRRWRLLRLLACFMYIEVENILALQEWIQLNACASNWLVSFFVFSRTENNNT